MREIKHRYIRGYPVMSCYRYTCYYSQPPNLDFFFFFFPQGSLSIGNEGERWMGFFFFFLCFLSRLVPPSTMRGISLFCCFDLSPPSAQVSYQLNSGRGSVLADLSLQYITGMVQWCPWPRKWRTRGSDTLSKTFGYLLEVSVYFLDHAHEGPFIAKACSSNTMGRPSV